MQKSKRLDIIKAYIKEHKNVQIPELLSHVDASESTVRRDIKLLVQEGFIKELYGSVILREKNQPDTLLKERLGQNLEAKNVIAKKAAKLIQNEDFIYIDAGSTTHHILKYIEAKNVTIVTNGLHIAQEAAAYNIAVYLLGGELKHTTMAVVGSQALESIEHYQFDACFMGTNGITEESYSTPDVKEGILKKHVISRSRKKYVCSDQSKLHVHTAYVFAKRDQCELITET